MVREISKAQKQIRVGAHGEDYGSWMSNPVFYAFGGGIALAAALAVLSFTAFHSAVLGAIFIAAIAALKGCQVLLCLNKCDLNTADELYDIYSHSALPVLRISAETGEGLAALRAAIAGKLNAFTGNSGVGKSSVLNRLLPELHLPVGEVSKALGRGRHTTRHVELFALGGGTYVIDTPGFSSFDTEEMDLELKAHLPETFPEFAPYVDQCRFTGCTHTKEKGCRVLQAVQDGDIPASRHRSYLRLYDELKDLRAWQKK